MKTLSYNTSNNNKNHTITTTIIIYLGFKRKNFAGLYLLNKLLAQVARK